MKKETLEQAQARLATAKADILELKLQDLRERDPIDGYSVDFVTLHVVDDLQPDHEYVVMVDREHLAAFEELDDIDPPPGSGYHHVRVHLVSGTTFHVRHTGGLYDFIASLYLPLVPSGGES